MERETAIKLGLAAIVVFLVFFVHCPTQKERYDEYYRNEDEGFHGNKDAPRPGGDDDEGYDEYQ